MRDYFLVIKGRQVMNKDFKHGLQCNEFEAILADALDSEFEAGAGDVLVIKAGEVHGFRCIGNGPLVQVDVHLSPRFIQENLT